MIVVTTDNVAGRPTAETLGLVRVNSVRARHLGRDITAALRNIVGGENPGYAELQSQSREQATQRMIAAGMSEILAYGTGVKLGE